jgi:hypothetical protein
MPGIKRFIIKFFILAVMLLGLPLLGIWLAGYPVSDYLEFPPETRYVRHETFSWFAFTVCALVIGACLTPLLISALRSRHEVEIEIQPARSFPWWGWLGLILGILSWVMAWTRFKWFAALQPHTFTPLWVAFIMVINGLCYRQRGDCMMLDRPAFFLLLFPISSAFWWFFEYLNRFVQNWYYIGPHLGAWEYFWYATLPFSTVLPAVLGLRDWLISARWLRHGFNHLKPLRVPQPRLLATLVLTISAGGLAAIGIWPNILFPLLWIAPLLIVLSLQVLMHEQHILSGPVAGNWAAAAAASMAAVICGVFWEMWNFFSLAKWQYSIPFVHRYQIFEMPLLGYAGYLPFGLQCAVVGSLLEEMIPAARST